MESTCHGNIALEDRFEPMHCDSVPMTWSTCQDRDYKAKTSLSLKVGSVSRYDPRPLEAPSRKQERCHSETDSSFHHSSHTPTFRNSEYSYGMTRHSTLLQPVAPSNDVLEAFLSRHRTLLQAERQAEEEQTRLLNSNCSPKLLEQRGLALGGLGVSSLSVGLGGKK